jgi:integrase
VPVFGPLKDKENRSRTIPGGDVVIDALAAHLAEYGAGPQGLNFTTAIGTPVRHSTWSGIWRRAAIDELERVGFHALGHFYASTLIRGGCSVKEVQERLGHSSAAMTLDGLLPAVPGRRGQDPHGHRRRSGETFGGQMFPRTSPGERPLEESAGQTLS